MTCVKSPMGMGSPPLTRGKVVFEHVQRVKQRITPAYAGKSFRLLEERHASGDHPRLRGEKVFESVISIFCRGSPPLTRGKEAARAPQRAHSGITPAYAGKSSLHYIQ